MPAEKRTKTTDTRMPCLLLDAPEILRNVYSFLTLKEALPVHRTCRHLRQNDLDVFQYSYIVPSPGYHNPAREKYDRAQNHVLCNLGSTDALRAVLRNKTLPERTLHSFIGKMVQSSRIDNTEALSVLLEDGRPTLSYYNPSWLLDTVLRKNFTGMAALLQQHESIREAIRMCSKCSANIGAYECVNEVKCRTVPAGLQRHLLAEDMDLPSEYVPPKYCRECVLSDKSPLGQEKFCGECSEYICPQCAKDRKYRSCFECRSTLCLGDNGRWCSSMCDDCSRRRLCKTCITRTVAYEEEGLNLCRPCRSGQVFGVDEVLERY